MNEKLSRQLTSVCLGVVVCNCTGGTHHDHGSRVQTLPVHVGLLGRMHLHLRFNVLY